MNDLTCDEVHDAAPQFALDILDAPARADVTAHLRRCRCCRQEVSGMQASAARLLDLRQPQADPLARSRRRLRVGTTLAAAAALAVVTTLGPELNRSQRAAPPGPTTSAALVESGHRVGAVQFSGGNPSIELAVSKVDATGRLTCEVVATDGSVSALGSFRLYEGSGYWSSAARIDPASVEAFDLVDSKGLVVASTDS